MYVEVTVVVHCVELGSHAVHVAGSEAVVEVVDPDTLLLVLLLLLLLDHAPQPAGSELVLVEALGVLLVLVVPEEVLLVADHALHVAGSADEDVVLFVDVLELDPVVQAVQVEGSTSVLVLLVLVVFEVVDGSVELDQPSHPSADTEPKRAAAAANVTAFMMKCSRL